MASFFSGRTTGLDSTAANSRLSRTVWLKTRMSCSTASTAFCSLLKLSRDFP